MDRLFLAFLLCLVAPAFSRIVKRSGDGSCQIDGVNVANGEYRNESCVQYQCVDGTKTPVSKECEYEGSCYPLNHKLNLYCVLKTCNEVGAGAYFQMDDQSPRCSISNTCYEVGQSSGCYHCMLNSTTNEAYVLTGCAYDGDKCLDVDTQVDIGCTTYGCSYDGTSLHFKVDSKKCAISGGTCLEKDATMPAGCSTLRCDETNGVYKAVYDPPKCSISGTCYGVDDGTQCIKCRVDANNYPYTESKCTHSGQCYEHGDKLVINCKNYTCETASVIGFIEDPVQADMCNYNGNCYSVGEDVPGCMKCLAGGEVAAKCTVDGICIDVGETSQVNCAIYTCFANGLAAYTSVTDNKCTRDGNTCYEEGDDMGDCAVCGASGNIVQGCSFLGQCFDDGETHTTADCLIYRCSVTVSGNQISYSMDVLEYHLNGNCFKRCVSGEPREVNNTDENSAFWLRANGCDHNGLCYSIGGTITSNCKTLACQHNGTHQLFEELANQPAKCHSDGVCYSPGDAMGNCKFCGSDGSTEYQCAFQGNYSDCHSEHATKLVNCKQRTCVVTDTQYGFVEDAQQPTLCQVDSQCYSPGDQMSGTCRFCASDGSIEYRCADGGNCYTEGTQRTINCEAHTCTVTTVGNSTNYGFTEDATQPPMCTYGGQCFNPGETMPEECMFCGPSGSTEYDCAYNGQCYPVGDQEMFNCKVHTCTKTVTSNYTSFSFIEDIVQSPVCRDPFTDECHSPGEFMSYCLLCNPDGSTSYYCGWSSWSDCHPPGAVKDSYCTTYTCSDELPSWGFKKDEVQATPCYDHTDGSCHVTGTELSDCRFCAAGGEVDYKCDFHGVCLNDGETATHKCSLYQCNVTIVGNTVTRGAEVVIPKCEMTDADGNVSCTDVGGWGIGQYEENNGNCTCELQNNFLHQTCYPL